MIFSFWIIISSSYLPSLYPWDIRSPRVEKKFWDQAGWVEYVAQAILGNFCNLFMPQFSKSYDEDENNDLHIVAI
jgi:hypothetical protein